MENTPDIDLLNADMSDVSPEEPLLAPGEVAVIVQNVEVKTSDSGSRYVSIRATTAEPWPEASGKEQLAPGKPLYGIIGLDETERRTKADVLRALRRFQLSCGINGGPFLPTSQYIGKKARVVVGFSKQTEEYPERRNEIKRWVAA